MKLAACSTLEDSHYGRPFSASPNTTFSILSCSEMSRLHGGMFVPYKAADYRLLPSL